ncbi:MAG TPA: PAS domain-containing protein [Kofleriaceae bacterium]|nr:PAS domain-containing protein [Kofleriaceae bacterium]
MGDSELHRVLDILPDLVARFDREGRFTYINAAALRAFGAPSEQLLGLTPVEILGFEASGRELHGSILTAAAQRKPRVLEVELETVDGRRAFEILHAPDFDASGEVSSVIGVARDITAHKQAETALRTREREYRTLAENTPDVIMRWDRDLRRTYGNPAFVAITGMPLATVIGTSLGSETPAPGSPYASYLAELARNVREVFATGESRTVALTRKTEHGAKVLETRFVPERDERGEIQTVLGIARDITRLQESEREARTLADHSPDLIARFDPQGRYAYVNRTLAEVTGIPASAFPGRHIGELLGTGAAAAGFAVLRERVTQAISTCAPIEAEIELAVGGKPLLFEIRLIPELDEAGALASVLAIGRDITTRRALEEQLVRAQKMEAVGHVAGAIAHDFNNMLNVMQMHASIALRAGDLESAWARVREILAATERAARLTRELLAFSSRRSANLVEIDLGGVIASVATLLGGSLGKAIALETKIAAALPRVCADAGMIEQALTNLAINARDAMPDGGVVEISLDDVSTAARPGRHVCMTVRDSGCGIAPEIQARIFEPYFTTKPVGKGTGLGLATVFGIVQQHDGWIEVDSVVDRGTAFRWYFPVT